MSSNFEGNASRRSEILGRIKNGLNDKKSQFLKSQTFNEPSVSPQRTIKYDSSSLDKNTKEIQEKKTFSKKPPLFQENLKEANLNKPGIPLRSPINNKDEQIDVKTKIENLLSESRSLKQKCKKRIENKRSKSEKKKSTPKKYFQQSKSSKKLKHVSTSLQKDIHNRRKSLDNYIRRDEEHTFEPRINEIPFKIYELNDKSQLFMSKEEIWKRLTTPQIEDLMEREKIRLAKEEENKMENCTFEPHLSFEREFEDNMKIEDRLIKDGEEKLKYINQLRLEKLSSENFPFHPSIGKSLNVLTGEKAIAKPLHERIDQVVEEKRNYMENLKMIYDEKENLNFHPQINEFSQRIFFEKNPQNFLNRMVEDVMNLDYKKLTLVQTNDEKFRKDCTFTPEINPISYMGENNSQEASFYKFQKDFSTRQYLIADYLREKKEKLCKEFDRTMTFKPTINEISEMIVASDPERINESLADKFDRLSKIDHEKAELLKQDIRNAYYSNLTFQPEIDEISKKLGKAHTIEALATKKVNHQAIAKIKEEQTKREFEECTFKPKIQKKQKFEHIKSGYSLKNAGECLQKEMEDKIIKTEELKRKSEYNELKDCSFTPKINHSILPMSSLEVKGLDKHLQRQNEIIQREKLKLEIEDKVFHLEKKYQVGNRPKKTKIQPFDISRGNHYKQKVIRKEIEAKSKEECTFHPKTNYQLK